MIKPLDLVAMLPYLKNHSIIDYDYAIDQIQKNNAS